MRKKLHFLLSMVALMLVATVAKAQEDVTATYIKNADLTADVTDTDNGWTCAWRQDYQKATDDAHVNVVEFYAGWGSLEHTAFSVSQSVTLPAGDYRIAVNAFYRRGNDGDGTNNGDAYIFAGENKKNVTPLVSGGLNGYTGSSDLWKASNAFYKGKYSNEFDFSLEEESTIDIGFAGKFDQMRSWVILGPVKLYKYSLDDYLADFDNKVTTAENLLADVAYAAVTGEERTALAEAAAVSTPTTTQECRAAISALTEAATAFTNALVNYKAFADAKDAIDFLAWPYASAEKKAAVEAVMEAELTSGEDAVAKAAALQKAYRQFVESNALAEGVEGAVDMTSLISNPLAESAIASPWTVVKGEGSGGGLDVKSNEPWTDGSDNSTYKYFDGGDWGANSWDVSLVQEVTLNPGKYLLTAVARASGDVAFSLFAGDTKVTIPAIGATGGVFNRGWNDAFVEFEVELPGAVQIGVQGVVTPDHNHNWMSFSNFRLVQLEAGEMPTTKYDITVEETENGLVEVNPTSALAGETVTITVTPDEGYMVDEVKVTYGEDKDVSLSEPTETDGVLSATFTMPAADVNVKFTFKKLQYRINKPEKLDGGSISVSSKAAEGEEVTIAINPDYGYEVESVSVKTVEGDKEVAVSQDPEHVTNYSFIMPAEAVTISVVFKASGSVEPETPTYAATLTHTASSSSASDATVFTSTVDAEKEHVNNAKFGNTWAGAAYADFSVATLPAGVSITKATLTFTAIGEKRRARATDVLYVNAGAALDYDALATGTASADLAATRIQSVDFPQTPPTDSQKFEIDATEALNTILAAGQKNIIFKWTGNQGGGDVAGKASENAPTLIIEYIPGAPEIANASFEADGEQATSNGPLTLTGWTFDGVGGSYNNTEIRGAGSTSTTSQFGTSDPSDGEYSLFLRQGWNGSGNTITLTSDPLAKIPAGDYVLSVDYKTYYSYDNTQSDNTKVGISLINGKDKLAEDVSGSASGVQGSANTTYFNDAEWSTLTASFSLTEDVAAGAQVVISLYAGGQRRSDFFIDNVQLVKVPGVELALIDLKKAIEAAEAKQGTYAVGDGLFLYAESEIAPLAEAITAAQNAYSKAESKDAVEAATSTLNTFVEGFAPTMTAPEADKQYTFQSKQNNLYMTLSAEGIAIAEEPYALSFESAADGKFYVTDGEYYVGLAGTDNWSMSAVAANKEALAIQAQLVDGTPYYTLGESKGLVGVDYPKKENYGCWANKGMGDGDAVLWAIAEYVAPEPEPEPVDPDLTEVALAQQDTEGAMGGIVTLAPFTVDSETGVTTYTTPADDSKVTVLFKMKNVDVKGCDYILIKFAEEPPAGLSYSFWTNNKSKELPTDKKELKYVFADSSAESEVSAEGIIPEISIVAIFQGDSKVLKVEGVYLHKAEVPDGIDGIAGAKAKTNGKFIENGQVVIYRNGQKYSVTGVQLK